MIYIACATYKEAEKLIKKYELKAENHVSGLAFYKSEEIALFVTKVGLVNAAVSVARFLACEEPGGQDIFINFGACAGEMELKGRLFLAGKLVEEGSERTFFPDQIITKDLGLNLKTIVTVMKPVQSVGTSDNLYEMEAAGVYQAAITCFSTDCIIHAKYVSDAGTEGGIIDVTPPESVIDDMDKLISCCLQYVKGQSLVAADSEAKTRRIQEITVRLSSDLSASVTMEHEIRALLEFGACLGVRPEEIYNEFMGQLEGAELPVCRKTGKLYLGRLTSMVKARFLLGE